MSMFNIYGLLKPLLLISTVLFSAASNANETEGNKGFHYLIGAGIADVTGPAYGNPMWGYAKPGQNTEGIHTRLKSRAFIFVDPNTQNRLLFASVDVGSIEHHIFLEVLGRLKERYGHLYHRDNTVLSATHTHSGPDGYSHTRLAAGLVGVLNPEHFNRVVTGIVGSIEIAHKNLQPANILINHGDVTGAGANRSMKAYNANPEEERKQYSLPMDLDMTLLRLQGAEKPFASINWFAVHPTSMTFNNKLISGDHKGYASLTWEEKAKLDALLNDGFIAAFSQSTPGDVTPNLNLNNTGPGVDDIDSTEIIGQRQLMVAETLFDQASEVISGPIESRQMYVDMSNLSVTDTFTLAGDQVTCPSAYGYAFAAGSTEDGGGHFLFKEGMRDQKWWLDFIIRMVTDTPDWTQAVKDCQAPKAILFETGSGAVPLQSQIRSLTISRLGSMVIVAMPAEITTMAARRIRKLIRDELGEWAKHIVIAGYSNGYAGYITTPEEYQTQQYEGGHTLHGKWTLPGYLQSLSKLAKTFLQPDLDLTNIQYDDWRGKAPERNIFSEIVDSASDGKPFGQFLFMDKSTVKAGESITLRFVSGNPSTGYRKDNTYVSVEYKDKDGWVSVLTDMAWSTIIKWKEEDDFLLAEIQWTAPKNIKPGVYRVKHLGNYRLTTDEFHEFESVSPEFNVH